MEACDNCEHLVHPLESEFPICKVWDEIDEADRNELVGMYWDLFPPNFLKYKVHLQHNHSTGMTEGAVHALCNAVMWQYEGR